MKTPILNIAFSFILAFSSLFLVSCEKDNPGGGGGDQPDPTHCTVSGTFTQISCGVGIYGNYWIRLDDGKYLQPCETDIMTLNALDIREGTKIRFGYKNITGTSSCDAMLSCAPLDARVKGTTWSRIRITCIEITQQPQDCAHLGTIRLSSSCNVKYIEADNKDHYEPVNQVILDGYNAGEKIRFSYIPVLTLAATCSGSIPVQVNCISRTSEPDPTTCTPLIIGYNDIMPAPNGAIHVQEARIEGNCLKLKIGFSGCDANTGRIALLWDGKFHGPAPHVNLVLVDNQPQACNAYFTKEVSFDLSMIKQSEQGQTPIHVSGWSGPLVY